jgi:hypothetical protein
MTSLLIAYAVSALVVSCAMLGLGILRAVRRLDSSSGANNPIVATNRPRKAAA